MKKCLMCQLEKSFENFGKDKNRKDGYFPYCKMCRKEKVAKRYLKHKDDILRKNKEWTTKNKERKIENDKLYYKKNKSKIHQQNNNWKINNLEKWREYHKNYQKERRKDPIFRILDSMRSRLRQAVKFKYNTTMSLVGCDIQQLLNYLESKFVDGMTWDNYGKWHIDHIKPCISFDLSTEEGQKKCFHYTNLQPLWAKDNMSKNSTYNGMRLRQKTKIF